MTELTGLTVWGETVKKVKTVRTKNYVPAVKEFRMNVNKFSTTVNSFRKV